MLHSEKFAYVYLFCFGFFIVHGYCVFSERCIHLTVVQNDEVTTAYYKKTCGVVYGSCNRALCLTTYTVNIMALIPHLSWGNYKLECIITQTKKHCHTQA